MKDHIYRRYLLRKPRKLKPMPQPPEGCMYAVYVGSGHRLMKISDVENVMKENMAYYDKLPDAQSRKIFRLRRYPSMGNDE